ncbi:MAG: hypothetical protein HYZ09_04375 [Candidatus Kerfeldbacteria bacterium]|nr:hypothetical protein [Candidatus Kerfeldbacteria bacterium]
MAKPFRTIKRPKLPSTQQYLDILEIRDDTVVLKDGTLRAVLLVSSVNFALKSEEEQNAVIASYTQFLNALDFPVQIVVQSRQLSIDAYLDRLKQIEKTQTNDLLRTQTTEYRQFVAELVEIADIMTKRFYVVVPFSPKTDRPKGFFLRFSETFSASSVIHLKQKQFEEFRLGLMKRVDAVVDGLASAGLKAAVLDTQSLIELYYNTYNPETYANEKMNDTAKIRLEE